MLIQCRHSERGEKTLLPYTGAAEPKESERERSDGEGKLLERKATKPASNTCDPRPRLLSQFRSLVARGALFLSCSNTHLKRFLFAGAKAEPKRFREECEWRPRFFSSSLPSRRAREKRNRAKKKSNFDLDRVFFSLSSHFPFTGRKIGHFIFTCFFLQRIAETEQRMRRCMHAKIFSVTDSTF